ncbi:uncharacterized protein [Epargyreus clarus]|uniref:uncharacterized protein isoform X4 n=1 Tax=Epargyreus clarus TaxID=520877 RepID=UPI003C30486A
MGSNCCKGDAAGRPVVRSNSSIYTRSRAGASLDERFIVSDDAGGVRLTVSAARTGDSGVYTLQASNAAGKDTTRVRLEVSPPDEAPVGDDPPNFLRRLQDLTVKVGTRTRFLVEIVSSTECKVTWYRNERRLLETERVALVRDGNFWCADVATVSVDDAGRWTCTAENVGGRASCSAHLNVLVPRAYKRPEFVEELRALLTEQGTVSLECKVVGVPTPVLRWFKDSREIKAGDVFALTANAEDPTSLGTYTCEAVNCMGRAYSSSKVHVVGRASREGSIRPSSGGLTPDPPPIFTKELEDQFVRICEPLTLSCHIVVPPWPRSVAWYNKEGKIEPSERYHVLEDGVGGYLVEVSSAEWADEGEWKCAATTPGGRVGMSACYVSMDVPKNYRKPRFMENLQAVLTEEGLVSFECKVVGFPTPVLSWFKDGQELKPGDVYQLTGTNSLGSYCCIARNCMGQASSSAELTVEDIQNQLNEEEKHQLFSKNQAPKFLQGLKSVEAKIDEPFRFTIKVAIPPEPSLLWYRDDQPVDESPRCHHGKEDRGVFYLDIQNLEFLDQAEWKCVAINDFGQSVTSCFLKLIIPRHYKKPRFLENLQAILSDEGAVNLECKVIGVPQPVLKWYKDGEELKPGDIHRIISGQDGTCCLGTYTCEAQNCMGIAASSASLLGFDDSMKVKSKKKSEEQTLQRNLSLSTIHEERTSQMYDTPIGDRTLDDKGEISFSFDGKEVSVSLYETPDLTEEEALQIVEMYADQLSENVTEHNVVELPPLRFVKETSTSGNLLMEAIIIDVSPEYFTSPEEDLRTEADIEDISIADENGPPQLSLDQDQDILGEDYLEKTMALLSDEKADLPKKISRKKSDSQKSVDDYFSLSRDQSLSEEKKDDDTHVPSESELQSFASARSSGKPKSKSSKPSLEEPILQSQESSEVTKTMLFKEDIQTSTIKPDVATPKPKRERRSSRSSRRSSSGSEKSLGKLKDEISQFKVEQPPKKLIADEEYKTRISNVANSLSKIINDIQIIERDIILQSELMSSAATASKSLEIISSLISPISEIHSIAEAAKEDAFVSPEINSALFNNLPQPFKVLYQSLTIIEKCIDVESDSKTLVKKTCISLIEKCGNDIQNVVTEINSLLTKKNLDVEAKMVSEIDSLSAEMITLIRFSADTIKARSLLHEAREIKSDEPSLESQHSKDTQKAIFELKSPVRSLLRIVESAERDNSIEASKIKNSEFILDDMSASIQDLQEALEQIESLSVKESTSTLMKYNTEIIETVMDSVLKLRSSIEQLSNEGKKAENENILQDVLSTVKLNLNEISSHIDEFENNVGKFDVLQSENKLEILQKMAQTLISFENSLPTLDVVPGVKDHMVAFHKNLTKVLENVIESNDATKYFGFMEICDSISRVNNLVKNIETHDLFSLTCLSNTLKIIQDQFINNVFEPELNCSVLNNIEDIQINLLKNINLAEEVSIKTDSDRIYELDVTKHEESKPNVVIESIEQSIVSINSIIAEECPKDFKSILMPILENIKPNLEELKQNIALMAAVNTEQDEHTSEISENSITQFLANPLCKLYENVVVLNQTIMENVDSFKENSAMAATYAQPLHELHTTLEVLQQEVLSQQGEDVLSYENVENIANVVQNLQSCIVLIQEQSAVETADEMSTLEDVSGIKTTADIMPPDHLVLPTTEVIVTEQVTGILKQMQPDSTTAQTLQTLNEHLAVLQNPDIIEFLDTLSEVSDYTNLKSIDYSLGELNEGIQQILHPILIENTSELLDSLDISKFIEIAEPMQDLHQSLSVIDASNIPIYENILKMPSEKIHSVIEKLSEFKHQLEKCLNVIIPAIEAADNTLEISSNINLLKKSCVGLKNTIIDAEDSTVSTKPEVCAFSQTLNRFLEATNIKEGIDATVVKSLTEDLYEQLLLVQDELIQYTPQPGNKIAQEVKLIETVHELESKIAVLEQYNFVDLSRASDIDSHISPQVAIELQTDSLAQVDDLVDQAVHVVQDISHETYTADLMILEDFFKTCKHEFSILRCLISKRPSHKKIIRLLQEFSVLKSIVNDFKLKRFELSLTEDINQLLNNFILSLDISMKDIEESLTRVVDSQSVLLFEMPVKNLDSNTDIIMHVTENNKTVRFEELVSKFAELVDSIRPHFINIKSDIMEELQSSSTSYQLSTEKSIVNECMDSFHNYLEEQMINVIDDDHKRAIESLLHCLQKYQDYKDVVGNSKMLMLLKCLSECSTSLKEMLTDEVEQNKQPVIKSEDIALKSILNAMVEPLQSLRSQLLCVQEQITSGADEESISIDLTSTESYVQALAEINADVLKVLQSDKTVVDEEDLSLIESLDKEINTLHENIQTVDNTGVVNVAKQIALPLEDLEKSLHLAKGKVNIENKTKISKDINSNISSFEYCLNRFIELETDILDISELFVDIDFKKCLHVAFEITTLMKTMDNLDKIDSVQEFKKDKIEELTSMLLKFDWLNTDYLNETRDEVVIEKMKRVFLASYQLFAELNRFSSNFSERDEKIPEDKAEALLQHIEQYIEFVEIVEEVSAIIKVEDLLETANLARELRESIDDVDMEQKEINVEIGSEQELLMQKLQRALSALQVQASDSVHEIAPAFNDDIRQHVLEVVALLEADIRAITGIQIAVVAPSENGYEEIKPTEDLISTTNIMESEKKTIIIDEEKEDIKSDTLFVSDVSNVELESKSLPEEIQVIKSQEVPEISGIADLAEDLTATEAIKYEDITADEETLPLTGKSEPSKAEQIESQDIITLDEGGALKISTIGTFVQHIDEYISEDVIETINKLAEIVGNKELETSVQVAKELRESIVALEVSPLEAVALLQNDDHREQQGKILKLQEALDILNVLTVHNAEELKSSLDERSLERLTEVVNNLNTDVVIISPPPILEIKELDEGAQDVQTQDSAQTTEQIEIIEDFKTEVDTTTADMQESRTEDLELHERDVGRPSEKDVEVADDKEILVEDALRVEEVTDGALGVEDIDSMKKLQMLLSEVNNQVDLASSNETMDDTELLRNILDEVQTVIIKLKRDFNGSANDTLNETLEDLECSVRSVQLQIDENSAPELLKDACATLQLLVTNMTDIKDHAAHPVVENTENLMQRCSENTELTIRLLDDASKADTEGELKDIISKLNFVKDTLKTLWSTFRGDSHTLINNGIDVIQSLDQMEEQIFSLEKDIDSSACKPDIKDSIVLAVHTVYENISNMRSTITSIQKDYMYENYGKPSEKFLHSLKNLTVISKCDNKNNWKHFGKVLRQVLNHFEDIKFYVNFDKTARIPSDAAFTKIVLNELSKELKEVVLTNVLELYPEIVDQVCNILKNLEENYLSVESRTTLEVKEKIPIFKNISEQIFNLTDIIRKHTKNLSKKEIKLEERDQENGEKLLHKESLAEVFVEQKQALLEVKDANVQEAATAIIEDSESFDVQDVNQILDESLALIKKEDEGRLDEEIQYADAIDETIGEKLDVIQSKQETLLESETMSVEVAKEQSEESRLLTESSEDTKARQEELPSCSFKRDEEVTESHEEIQKKEEDAKIKDQITSEMEITESERQYMEKEEEISEEKDIKEKVIDEVLEIETSKLESEIHEKMPNVQQTDFEADNKTLQENVDIVGQKEEKEEVKDMVQEAEKQEAERKGQDEEVMLHEQKDEEEKKQKEEFDRLEQEIEVDIQQATQYKDVEQKQEDRAEKQLQEKEDKLSADKEKQEIEKEEKVSLPEQEEVEEDEEKLRLEKAKQESEGKLEEEEEKQEIEEDVKHKEAEEKLRAKSEKEEIEEKLKDEEAALQTQKDEEEPKPKEEEHKQLTEKEKQESKKKGQEEIEDLLKKKKEADSKETAEEEKLTTVEEKQEFEKKRQDEEAALQKEIDEAELKREEEEGKPSIEKQEQEIEERKPDDEVALEKQQEEAEVKRENEGQKVIMEIEKQVSEKGLQEVTDNLQKQEKEAEIKHKEKEEHKVRTEKGEHGTEKKQDEDGALQKQEAKLKRKEEEEILRTDEEEQKMEKNLHDEEAVLQSQKEEEEIKRKDEGEQPYTEEEQQEIEKKQQDEEAVLQTQKKGEELKRKEEQEKLSKDEEKEEHEVEKLRQDKEVALQTQKDEAELKCKEEEEKLHDDKEKQDVEKQRQDEEVVLLRQKEELELKCKEEEGRVREDKEQTEIEKKRKDEEVVLETQEEELDSKRKNQDEGRSSVVEQKEMEEKQQDQETALCTQKEEPEIIRKEDEKHRSEKEKQEAEKKAQDEKAALQTQKEDAEGKEEEEQKLRKDREQAVEKKLQDENTSLQEQKGKAVLQTEKEDTVIETKDEEVKCHAGIEQEDIEKEGQDQEAILQKQIEEEDKGVQREEENKKRGKEKEHLEVKKKEQEEKPVLQSQKEEPKIQQKEEKEELLTEKEQEPDKKKRDEESTEEEKHRTEKEQQEVEKKQDDGSALQPQDEDKEEREKPHIKKEQEMEEKWQDQEEEQLKEEAMLKREKGEQKLRLEKEAQESDKNDKEEADISIKQKREAEIELKEEEKLPSEKEQTDIKKKRQEEETLLQQKEDTEIKCKEVEQKLLLDKEHQESERKRKEEEEKLRSEIEKQEIEKKRQDEEQALLKQKEEIDRFQEDENQESKRRRKEEEKNRSEKEKQEIEEKRKEEEECALQKQTEEAEIKRKEEEQDLFLKQENQESERKRQEEAERLQTLEKEAEMKRKEKEEEEKLRLDKEKQEIEEKRKEEEERLQRLEKETEMKRKKEEKLRSEKEEQEIEKKRKEEEKMQKEKEEADIKHKEEEQKLLEQETQENERKRQEEAERLQTLEKEAEIKRKEEEEKLRIEKEKQEIEKRQQQEENALQKQKEEAEIKRKEEEQEKQENERKRQEEAERLQKLEKEAAMKRTEEEEKLRSEKEEADIKRKEEEQKLLLEQETKDKERKRLEEAERLQKLEIEAEMKRKDEEEKLRLEKEKQEIEKKRQEEEERLQKLEEEAEIKRKEEEEKLRLEKEKQEIVKKRQEEEERLQKLEKEAEMKREEEEEKLRLEKEKQEIEKKRQEEENALLKQKKEAEIKRKEEEQEKQESERKRQEEAERLQKLEKEKEMKRKEEEEEKLRSEKERQEIEKKRKEEEALQKQKEEAEIKRKEEEQRLALEREKQESERKREEEAERLQKLEKAAEIKRKEEEENLRLEKEKQEIEKKRQEEENALLKQKEEAEIKRKEEEQEKQESERKRQEEAERLQKLEKEKENEMKRKEEEEEKLRSEKERQEKEKKRKEEEALQKQKEEAEIKRKEEEQRLALEREKQESERKREEEAERLQKLEKAAEIKRKEEEENLRLEKEKQEIDKKRKEEEERLQKLEKETEMKRKEEEEKLRLKKEKQENEKKRQEEENALLKQKEEAEMKRKEEEQEKQENERKRQEEAERLQKLEKEKEIIRKEEGEKLRSEQEKQKIEKERKDEEAEIKRKEVEQKILIEEEKQESERKRQEEAERVQKLEKEAEEKLRSEKEKQEIEKKRRGEEAQKQDKVVELKDKKEKKKLRLEKDKEKRRQQQADEIKMQKGIEEKLEQKSTGIEKKSEIIEDTEMQASDEAPKESSKFNGSIDNYRVGEIDVSSLSERKYEGKEKPAFINYNNNNDIGLEMYRPPGYIEKRNDQNIRIGAVDLETPSITPITYKAQTLLNQAQLRSSTPQYYEMGRSSESIEKRDVRHIPKVLSETSFTSRSTLIEKRIAPRDHKRKPVFSTYLTDRTAVEGSRVKLTCSVLSSTDPTITWFKNGVLLDNKLKYRTKFVDGLITLEVLNAVPSDSAEYTCTIKNESGTVSSSANLKVYPSFEASPIPPTFTRSIRDTYHLAENELVLECRIRGQPLPNITWLKDDLPISSDDRYQAYYLADGVCRLAISAPTTADSGKYTCKAENSMWSDQITHVVNFTGKESRLGPNLATIERSRFNRQVLESRRPHFTNVLTDYKVTRGGTIGLQVEIKGSPTRVEWLREGHSVTDIYRNAHTFVEHGLYTLALTDVTEKETGLYTCRAWGVHGNVDMNAAITVVQPNELGGKPAMIVSRPEKDVLISVGEDLNISFRVQGEPKPKVIFMKGIRDITTSQRVCKMTSDDYVKFTLKRSVVSDAGTYCILARNAYGCDRAFVTVVVRQRASSENLISDWTYPLDDIAVSIAERKYKSVPDRIPGEPSVVDGGNNWVSLAWSKPDHQESAPVLAYKVESWLIGKEGGARWVELGITPLNSFDAFNLKQGEEYHFRVTPRNRYGWGEAVQTSNAIGIGLAGDRPEFTEILPGQLKVLLGQTANLNCSFKGKPIPEIVWMKNGHEIEDNDDRIKTLLSGFDCCLTIKNVQIEDEARYSCEASNVHGRASTYARMAVITDRLVWEADAKLKRERSAGVEGEFPPQFTMRLRDRRVQATYPVRLTCQVIGSPPPLVTWFKDGMEVCYDNRRSQSQDEHFHTLEIAPTSLEDGGVYEAMARNSSGAVSCRCSLVVDKGIRAYIAPEFCCGLEPLYRLFEGEELRISAMVEAYPSVGVTWYRDGVRLRPSRRAVMTLDHDGQIELALAAVTSRDAGVYTCAASNEVGRASTSGKVEVVGGDHVEEAGIPPVVISPDVPYSKEPMFIRKPRSSEAREGDTVIIECEVIGDPKPDVYWLRDFLKPDYYRDANHFKRVGAGPEYRFEIPHAKLDYTGTYSVVARNAHGEAKAIISLQILAKDITAPDDAHNIRYGRVDVIPRFDKELTDLLCYDGDAVEFECRVSGNPEPYIKWLHYNEVIHDCPDFETSFEEGTARLKIKQVTAEDEGTFTCEASNSLGKAKSSACLVVYPPGEPNTLSQRLRRPALLSAASTPRSTPRATPARSLSRTPGPDARRLCSPSREIAPKFYTYPFNKVVEEGERVVFKCAVKGLPNPWATWDKDGIVITPTSRITIREKDEILRILEIEEVTIEDVGLYRITLENDYGRAEASARLEVITHKGKFYGGIRSASASPRRTLYRRRTPSTSRQD